MTTIANLELKAKKTPSNFEKVKIISSNDAFKVIKQFYFDDIDIFESFKKLFIFHMLIKIYKFRAIFIFTIIF